MPPPNQWTGSASRGSAASMRTFMCTVGAYGLRGWNTSETPMASNEAPTSSGRCWVAEGGSCGPRTCEKPTPARSNTWPCSRIMVTPSPCSFSPGSFFQASARKAWPSISAMACVMRCCSPVSQVRTAVMFASIRFSALHGAEADVAAVLRAVELDAAQDLVGALLRRLDGIRQRGDAQDAAAGRDRGVALRRGAGVEHHRVLRFLRQAADHIAVARVHRVAGGGHHHAQRGAAVPVEVDLV